MKKVLKQTYKKGLSITLLLVVIALLILPAVYTNSLFGYLPIIAGTSLFFLSGIYLLIMKNKISVDAKVQNIEVVRGQQVLISLVITNKSFLVCS